MSQEVKRWVEFTDQEKAAALDKLADYMGCQPNSHRFYEARSVALFVALGLDPHSTGRSPVRWEALNRIELTQRLLEVSAWSESRLGAPNNPLRSACLELVEDMHRRRFPGREERSR